MEEGKWFLLFPSSTLNKQEIPLICKASQEIFPDNQMQILDNLFAAQTAGQILARVSPAPGFAAEPPPTRSR
jgi:hypothetical protein